ncbi:hypothetical protein ACHAWT_007225 [Skeletonema menzelii]
MGDWINQARSYMPCVHHGFVVIQETLQKRGIIKTKHNKYCGKSLEFRAKSKMRVSALSLECYRGYNIMVTKFHFVSDTHLPVTRKEKKGRNR